MKYASFADITMKLLTSGYMYSYMIAKKYQHLTGIERQKPRQYKNIERGVALHLIRNDYCSLTKSKLVSGIVALTMLRKFPFKV